MSEALSPLKPVLRIDFPPGERLGHGKIELMELIVETGSISAAGRAMETDARNGVIVRLGRRHGIATPINQMIVALLEAATSSS